MRAALVALVAISCAGSPDETVRTPEERGERLASDPAFSGSSFNAFACTTCHAIAEGGERILPGAPLGGAVRRPWFWSGRFFTIREAIDQCLQRFMRGAPLDPESAAAKDLYAYLRAIADKGPGVPQPFNVVIGTSDLPAGDRVRGEKLWDRACRSCHGAPNTGAGRLTNARGQPTASIVPNDTLDLHAKDGIAIARQVIIEKIRHGAYLGFPGSMPPFSRERLTDEDVAALAAYLDLYR